jgi:hypothetical protein
MNALYLTKNATMSDQFLNMAQAQLSTSVGDRGVGGAEQPRHRGLDRFKTSDALL